VSVHNGAARKRIVLSLLVTSSVLMLAGCGDDAAVERDAAQTAEVAKRIAPVGEVEVAAAAPTPVPAAEPAAAAAPAPAAAAAPAEQPAGVVETATGMAESAMDTAAGMAESMMPGATAPAADTAKGKAVYDSACFACHMTGAAGAPKLGDKALWAPRIAQGMDVLNSTALNGKGAMPPKGGRMDLSDEDVKAAVAYMVEQSQ